MSESRLVLLSILVHFRAGRFPTDEAKGVRYLKISVKAKAGHVAIFAVEPGR